MPDDIEVMPPGPKLSAVLAGVDRSRLADADLVVVAQARARQLAYEQAGQMADLVAIADAAGPDPFPPGGPIPGDYNPDQWAESEIAAAMTWTGLNAGVQLALARQIVRRLPALHAAMRAGDIDAHKARVICDQLLLLSDEQARAVVEKILPEAAGKTTGQLRYRLARLVITIDPDAARKRYRERVTHRQVWCGREEEGTLSLGGRHLPADRAAAAFDHLDALATALLEAGDTRGLEALRADVMLDLLQGLITNLQPDPDTTDQTETTEPAEDEPRGRADGTADADPQPTGGDRAEPAAETRPAADIRPASAGGGLAMCPHGCRSGGGLELTVPMTTLMRLAEHPGELGSWGPVIADVARKLAHDLATAPWRFSVTDQAGRVIWNGPTRRRPTAGDAAYVKARDRRCRFPSCRRRARRCQIDHTDEHRDGGPSIPCNLGCLCARHHGLKTKGIWRLWQIPDGTFIWRSPLGRTYVVKPEPVDDPEPDDPPAGPESMDTEPQSAPDS